MEFCSLKDAWGTTLNFTNDWYEDADDNNNKNNNNNGDKTQEIQEIQKKIVNDDKVETLNKYVEKEGFFNHHMIPNNRTIHPLAIIKNICNKQIKPLIRKLNLSEQEREHILLTLYLVLMILTYYLIHSTMKKTPSNISTLPYMTAPNTVQGKV